MIVRAVVWVLLLTMCGCGGAELRFADGTETSYDDWKGRWVLVNYWAEWCAPCRQEIPELNTLFREHTDQVLVVGVNFDGVKDVALTDLIARMAIDFPVLVNDPRDRWQYDRPGVLPTTIVIDPSGNVVRTLVGPQTRSVLIRALGL